MLDIQRQGHREEEMRHEAANDDVRIIVVRVIVGGHHDRGVHDNPGDHGVRQGHQRGFKSPTPEVGPNTGKKHAPKYGE
jgi:hypothetical protein